MIIIFDINSKCIGDNVPYLLIQVRNKKVGFKKKFTNMFNLSPKMNELIYWRDPGKTGVIFGSILAVLVSVTSYSCISVFTYASLAVLLITFVVFIAKSGLQAVLMSGNEHPFKELLETDLALPADKVHEFADAAAASFNGVVAELRRLFLIQDIWDSARFGVILVGVHIVGAMFNGFTLIILAFVGLFTLPKVYETHQDTIDQGVDYVRKNMNQLLKR